MPKKRKKEVEIIKFDGLTSDTVREFEPRDAEDDIWERYFLGDRGVIPFSNPPAPDKHTIEKIEVKSNNLALTPVETPVETPVITPVESLTIPASPSLGKVGAPDRAALSKEAYQTLDSTHTGSEARVYSSMYRETITKGYSMLHFGTKRLMELTGIRGDHTIRRAIDGLIAKKSIEIIDPNFGHPLGPKYRVLVPKEIFLARKKANIRIDPQTKKILTPVETPVATPVATPVKTTPVTPVKMTGYLINSIKWDEGSSDELPSSNRAGGSNADQPRDDDLFDHYRGVVYLYQTYTGNEWKQVDQQRYPEVSKLLLEIVEAGIISSVLRCSTKIHSFSYCIGAIMEFSEFLPPGYLGYLRLKFEQSKAQAKQPE